MTNTLRAGLLALSLAGLVIHSPAFAEDANRAARYYEDGLERFNKGDVDGAVVQLKNALQQSPDMLQAHVLLGRSLLEQLELPAAEASFDKALALGVSPREIAVYRARLYLSLGRSKAVLQEITADGLPTRARVEVLTARARAHAMEGDGQAAAAGFDAAMAADPQSVLPYLDLIPFLLESGRVEVADARLADLARLAPNDARTWNLRASISHLRGQLTQALAEYDKDVELEADYVDARIARASIRVDLKRFDASGDGIEAAFLVSLTGLDGLDACRAELQGLDPAMRLVFVDQEGLGGLD